MRFGSFQEHWKCGHHYTHPVVSFNGNDLSIEYLIKDNLEEWDITVKQEEYKSVAAGNIYTQTATLIAS